MNEKELEERFVGLIDRYKQVIYKVSLVYAYDDEVLNDLYQEVLLNLWTAFPLYWNECKESTWVYRVALNTCSEKIIGNSKKNSFFLLTFRFSLSHKDETNSFIRSRQDNNFESDQ